MFADEGSTVDVEPAEAVALFSLEDEVARAVGSVAFAGRVVAVAFAPPKVIVEPADEVLLPEPSRTEESVAAAEILYGRTVKSVIPLLGLSGSGQENTMRVRKKQLRRMRGCKRGSQGRRAGLNAVGSSIATM